MRAKRSSGVNGDEARAGRVGCDRSDSTSGDNAAEETGSGRAETTSSVVAISLESGGSGASSAASSSHFPFTSSR